jgi:threonine dehydrogenase-like Zn-dependent dehydrogenase
MDLDQKKVLLMQVVGRFYQNIYFSSYSPLQVQNLPRQSLPDNSWVRVRNRLSGICGSDLHLLYRGGSDPRIASAATPNHKHFYPGHEVVGEVIEIGDDVQRLHVGDRVVLQWKPNCLTAGVQPICRSCATGNFNLCEHGTFVAPAALGGGWSEEMLLHEQQLFRVPLGLTDEQAVMLEPVSIALHAVLRQLPQAGDRVLIIGAGTVGLLMQQIIRALVPQAEISVLARYPFQVEQATRLGAAHIIYQQDAYIGVQRATQARMYSGLFGNRTLQGGYDIIYDTIGQKRNILQHNTLHHALRWVRTQGTIVLVGLSLQEMNIDLTPLWTQEITLLGSNAHGIEYWPTNSDHQVSTFKAAAELMLQGSITPEQLITHHYAVNDYKHALLTATKKADSRAIKVVFDYSLLPASVVPNVRASAPRIRRQSTINFANEYEDNNQYQEEQPSTYDAGIQAAQNPYFAPKTSSRGKEIPSAQPHTKELAKTPKTPALEEDFDSDDTISALPAISKYATRNSRSYSSASQPQMPVIPETQMPANIEPQEFVAVPATPTNDDFYPDENEGTDRTQLISKAQLIPQTETDLERDSEATILTPRVVFEPSKDIVKQDTSLEDSPESSVNSEEPTATISEETYVSPEAHPSESAVEEPTSTPAESQPDEPTSTPAEPEPDELPDTAIEPDAEEPTGYSVEPEPDDFSSYSVEPEPDDFSNYPIDVDAEFSHNVLDTFEPDVDYAEDKQAADSFDIENEGFDPEIPFVDDSATIASADTFQSKERPSPTYGQQRSRNRKKGRGGR